MFRRKKDDDAKILGTPPPATSRLNVEDELAPPLKLYGKRPPAFAPVRSDIPRRGAMDLPGATRRHPADPHEGKKLIVGRDIELAGEITACDRLVVEGKVAADLTDAGVIEVAQTGIFRGSAEVDDADISGLFDGTLTVHRKLIIRGTGQVRGTIRYARIVIELGGEVHGTVDTIASETKSEDQMRQLTPPLPPVMVDQTS
ncbi:MAG: hypothetical protein FD153_390 [Rhodospirillaceae bacterium]|nr:MAG: hypothetical protein FD153_390 [Rhodospirillaceae bacterium]